VGIGFKNIPSQLINPDGYLANPVRRKGGKVKGASNATLQIGSDKLLIYHYSTNLKNRQ